MSKRVVHVANFPQVRLKGCFLDSMPFKITNGLTRLGYQVVNYSDRDALRMFGIFGHMNIFSNKKANSNFLEYCKVVQPDAIILEHADTIFASTLLEVKKILPGVKIMQINVDDINPKLGFHNINNLKSKLDVVDWTLITTADATRFEIFGEKYQDKIGFIPNPVDDSIETGKAFEHENLEYDVICAANPKINRQFCGKFENTSDIIDRVMKNIDMNKVLFPKVVGDKLDGANYQKTIANCAMGINLSRINEDYLYSSDRLAHLMGNGSLAIIDKRTGYGDIFSNEEAAFYGTEEELFDVIDYYRKNPKERMHVARNGWKKYHAMFNEKLIAKYVAELLFGGFEKSKYFWPTIGGKKTTGVEEE